MRWGDSCVNLNGDIIDVNLYYVKLERVVSKLNFCEVHNPIHEARGVCGGTTAKGLMSDGSPKGDFYRKQLLFSFKKRNKQSAYGTGTTGNKVKYDGGHTTVNVWI